MTLSFIIIILGLVIKKESKGIEIMMDILDTYVKQSVEPAKGRGKESKDCKLKTNVYLVFPALEDIVTQSLQEQRQRVFTFKFNGYKKTVDKRLKPSQTIENSMWTALKSVNDLVESVVVTDDLYIENVLKEHNVKFTVVYPESANKKDYIDLLEKQGYNNTLVNTLKNDWNSFLNAIPKDFNTQGVFTTYMKG